jgi:hypothetical protein
VAGIQRPVRLEGRLELNGRGPHHLPALDRDEHERALGAGGDVGEPLEVTGPDRIARALELPPRRLGDPSGGGTVFGPHLPDLHRSAPRLPDHEHEDDEDERARGVVRRQ